MSVHAVRHHSLAGRTIHSNKEEGSSEESTSACEREPVQTMVPELEMDSEEPRVVVDKYWRSSFIHPGKRNRTMSKARQQLLLGEELKRLENETLWWRGELSHPAAGM